MPLRERNKLNYGPTIELTQTGINELQNRPRQDINGQRYGNTLSDDMFSIKNPTLPNRHTPESIEYFNQPTVYTTPAGMTPAAGWENVGPLPTLNKNEDVSLAQSLARKYPLFRENNLVSREKNVTGDSLPWEVYKDWGLTDDIMEFPDYYTPEQVEWAQALQDRNYNQMINDLSTRGMMNEKFGNAPTTQTPRREAEVDTYLDDLVNYDALSPATIEQLVNMGVNRPPHYDPYNTGEPDASDYLMDLINAYAWAMENGYR